MNFSMSNGLAISSGDGSGTAVIGGGLDGASRDVAPVTGAVAAGGGVGSVDAKADVAAAAAAGSVATVSAGSAATVRAGSVAGANEGGVATAAAIGTSLACDVAAGLVVFASVLDSGLGAKRGAKAGRLCGALTGADAGAATSRLATGGSGARFTASSCRRRAYSSCSYRWTLASRSSTCCCVRRAIRTARPGKMNQYKNAAIPSRASSASTRAAVYHAVDDEPGHICDGLGRRHRMW